MNTIKLSWVDKMKAEVIKVNVKTNIEEVLKEMRDSLKNIESMLKHWMKTRQRWD